MKKRKSLTLVVPRVDIAGQLGTLEGTYDRTWLDQEYWTDGVVSIPKGRTTARRAYNTRYREAVIERYGSPRVRLSPMWVDARCLTMTNAVVNQARYEMYKRMLREGDTVPPLVVEDVSPSGD